MARFEKGFGRKALATTGFDESAAKANYVQMRVESLRTEMDLLRLKLAQAQSMQQRLQELLDEGCSQEAIDYL